MHHGLHWCEMGGTGWCGWTCLSGDCPQTHHCHRPFLNLCRAGSYSKAGGGTCSSCSAGTYSPDGSRQCYPCKPGTFNSKVFQSSCIAAPAGSYAPGLGST